MKVKSESEVAQSCPTFNYPMDCSLPGSSVHGIFQARVLEWGAIAFSKKNGTAEPICRAGTEMQTQRTDMWAQQGWGGGMNQEISADTCTLSGFPGGASSKEPSCQCRRHKRYGVNPWVWKIPWRRACNPLQYS